MLENKPYTVVNEKFAVIDAETDPFKIGRIPKPFIWGYYDGEIFKTFKTSNELIKFVEHKNITIYAHNGGNFDFLYLLEYISPGDVLIINGRLSRFKINNVTFLDSLNILPIKLADYKKTEIDYAKFESNVRHLHINEITNYLKDDCADLHDLIKKFRTAHPNVITLAGAALKSWTAIANTQPPKTTKKYFNAFKKYYYGGRTQAFQKGVITKKISVIDIKSSYPFAMTHKHPWGRYHHVSKIFPMSLLQGRDFVTLSCVSNGAFPFKVGKTETHYPTDSVSRIYNVTGWEYLTAKKLNLILKVVILEVTQFDDSIDFKSYVNHHFEDKAAAEKSGDIAKRIFAKLFLNSLYGKFAANPEKYQQNKIAMNDDIKKYEEEGYEVSKEISKSKSLLKRDLPESQHRYYDLAVAASITGFARAKLLETMEKCRERGEVIYCDTDSIFTTADVSSILSDELGGWGLENTATEIAIAGKKTYSLKLTDGTFKTRSKGVKASAIQVYRAARGEVVTIETDIPSMKIKTGMRFTKPRRIQKT